MYLLANQAGVILKNSIQYDKTVVNHHRLIRLIKNGNIIYEAADFAEMIQRATEGLKQIMFAEKAVILLYDEEKKQMFKVLPNGEREYYDLACGIIGKVIATGEIIDVANPNTDPSYNLITDLETNLPVLCMPIRSPFTNKIVGGLQVLNIKGVGSPTKGKVDMFEVEIIKLLCEQIATCAEKFSRKSSDSSSALGKKQPDAARRSLLQDIMEHDPTSMMKRASVKKDVWGTGIKQNEKPAQKKKDDSMNEEEEEDDGDDSGTGEEKGKVEK